MASILIIEDEVDLAELYGMALESAGHTILGIFDDPEIPLLHPAPRLDPDIIVLDERLRGRSGMAFLPDVRQAFPRARILFASADPYAVEVAIRSCADAARKKPFPLEELVAEITALINSRAPLKKCSELDY